MFSFERKYNILSILLSIALIILGGVFAFNPANSLITIIKVMGMAILIFGIIMVIRYFTNCRDTMYRVYSFDLIQGIISSTCGLVLIFNPIIIASILPFFLGIGLAMQGAFKLQYAFQLKHENVSNWVLLLVISIVTLVTGTIIAFNPFAGANVFTALIGWILIAEGIANIIENIALINMFEQIEKMMKK